MILDYIGQELIWNLRGNHPYQKNKAHYSITYRCTSYEQNIEICQFIIKHIQLPYISTIVVADNPFNNGIEKIVRQIKVKNVFGYENELNIINSNITIEE